MTPQPVGLQQSIRFGEDFELDLRPRRLRRGSHVLKLERIPLEILILLLERRGEIVSRDEIVVRVWGNGVFLDTDNSIRGAIRKVRQVLKDDPETPRFIQTVTGQGYRFIAPIVGPEQENGADNSRTQPAAGPDTLPRLISEFDGWLRIRGQRIEEYREQKAETPAHAESDHRRGTRDAARLFILSGVALLALLAVVYIAALRRAADAKGSSITSLAVLPLKNLSGDPSQDYLADGMTEELIGRLSGIHDLKVTSRTSIMHFKDTQLSVPEIAKRLGVEAVVEGSVIRDGNRIRVHAQLIRGATDKYFWSETYDRELRDVLALQSDVAQSIVNRIEVTVTGAERPRLVAARPVAPEVYESYLRGRRLVDGNNKAEIEASIAHFAEAIRNDATFAPAYVGLGRAYDNLATIFVGAPPIDVRPKVISAARKALELDPQLAEAHTLLADMYQAQWKWAAAESEYTRALDLNSNDAFTHFELASWLLCRGRMEEALASSRRADGLDPMDDAGTTAWILFNSRRYDDALREIRSVVAVHPESAMAHFVLGFALIGNKQYEEAGSVLEKTVSLTNRSPGAIGLLAMAYVQTGRRREALRLVTELKQRRQNGYVPAGAFIFPVLALGDYDQAFFWFEEAYKEQSNILQFLKVHPFFDPVRNDPRFADLLRRVGLDKE